MTDLRRLTTEGKVLIQTDTEFLTPEGGSFGDLEEYIGDDVTGTFNEETLDAETERLMDEYDVSSREDRNTMDAELAPVVHQAINVTRRETSKPGIWWYLTVVEYHDYVRKRWQYGNLSEKFLGIADEPEDEETARVDPELSSTGLIKDPYSIALNRLWWAAELTYDEETDDYSSTRHMFHPQRLANYILDSKFRRHPPAARAFADVFTGMDTGTIDAAADRFKRSLTLYQLEVRDYDTLCAQLESIAEDVS